MNLNLGETTITDLCLMAIAHAALPNVRIASARGRDEPDKGFDWEWFIRYPQSTWLRFSVQAKKLNPASGKYASLRHLVGERFQIDLLDDFAKAQGSIPLYAFYNLPPPGHSAKWNCAQSSDDQQYGCTLAPLQHVRTVHAKGQPKDFDAIHAGPHAYPWRCIACTKSTGAGPPDAGPDVMRALVPEGVEVRHYEELPRQLRNIGETRHEVELAGREYESPLGAYPKRIAIIDLLEAGRLA